MSEPTTPKTTEINAGAVSLQGASATFRVTRGPVSWAYFYIVMGFALSIEGTIVSMITPLVFPCNIAAFAGVAAATVYLCTSSAWFQNILLRIKASYEDKPR